LHFLVALPLSVLFCQLATPVHPRGYDEIWRGIKLLPLHLIIFIACDEILFFVTHYYLHKIPFLYKTIHSFHHQLRYTVSVGCEYAHPLEFIMGNIVPVILGPVLCQSHLLIYLSWITLKMFETIYVHSGFDFGLTRLEFLTKEHAYHHSHYQDNYGTWYGVCDATFKTNQHFLEYQKKKVLKGE